MVLDAFRARLGSIIGGFDAAQSHRRMRGFRATRAHVNTLIAASGETITARARWLVRNNGYAANAVDAFANHVVGDGIKPSSKIADAAKKEELQKLWLAWTDEADAEGLTDFFGLQRRAARGLPPSPPSSGRHYRSGAGGRDGPRARQRDHSRP